MLPIETPPVTKWHISFNFIIKKFQTPFHRGMGSMVNKKMLRTCKERHFHPNVQLKNVNTTPHCYRQTDREKVQATTIHC